MVILTALDLVTLSNISLDIDCMYSGIVSYLKDKGVDVDQVMTADERREFKKGLKLIAQAIIDYIDTQRGTDRMLSLVAQKEMVPMAHYPELCFSWLRSQDPNYGPGNKKVYSPTAQRIIYINCPVDVEVKDSNGVVVAALVDELPGDAQGYVLCGITADGAKRMYLPTNEAYTVTIKAREDCTMSFSVNKTDAYDTCDYIENYYDIAMKKGEVVTVTLPQEFFEEDGNVTIVEATNTLKTKQGTVEPNIILRGEQAGEAVYTVSVENANTAGGICNGGGEYVLGAYAKVSAAEYEDCEFLGWYEDNELLSTEREYRFRVTSNRTLTAKFAGETQYGKNGIFTAKVVAGEGGYVDPDTEIYALDGYPFQVTAIPGIGYEFDGWEADGNCILADPNELTTEVILIDEDVTLYAGWEKRFDPVLALGRIKKLMEWPAEGDLRRGRLLRRARDIGGCISAMLED